MQMRTVADDVSLPSFYAVKNSSRRRDVAASCGFMQRRTVALDATLPPRVILCSEEQ